MSRCLLAFAMASGAAGLVTGCKQEPAEHPTPTECLDQIRVRGLLAGLARDAAELGRFDPYVYPVGDGVPSPGAEEGAEGALLRQRLIQLRADPVARAAFEANVAQAKLACPEDTCAKGPFPTKVTRSTRFGELREVYELTFTGEAPPEQVLRAYATLFTYNGPQAGACTTPPAVDVKAMVIYVSADNCDSNWPPPNPGGRCSPPANGHWIQEGSDLCCRT